MDGYYEIAHENPQIISYDRFVDITYYIPFLGKKLAIIFKKKKNSLILKKYIRFSLQIRNVLDHVATHEDVIKLYEAHIPLIDDYIDCLKREKFLPREALTFLEDSDNTTTGIWRRVDYCAVLDVILACHKKTFSGLDIIYAYCFGFLSKDQALAEIEKLHLNIPNTIKLIKLGDKNNEKLEETYFKETKGSS